MDDDILLDEQPRRRRWVALFGSGGRLRRYGWRALLVLVVLALLYYPIGCLWRHKIDDNPAFGPGEIAPGASRAIAVAAALIDREVDQHGWPANDPWFYPDAPLDNMPNYQQGIISALARFTLEMTDQIGRSRGSSQADADLQTAAGQLQLPGTKWLWDWRVSIWPSATAEAQYRAARQALLNYNNRLAAGNAVFERRADNLLGTLDRIGADLGSASAVLEQRIETHSGDLIDFQADDIFYNTKGRLYAYALLLRELGQDFAPVIKERDLEVVWNQTVDNMILAARLQPWFVVNGAPDSQFFPSHLASQGFFLLRARTQLREITNILLK
jgi:hypothetical protein